MGEVMIKYLFRLWKWLRCRGCVFGLHKWMKNAHYTSIGTLEEMSVMTCLGYDKRMKVLRVFPYRYCSCCGEFQVDEDGRGSSYIGVDKARFKLMTYEEYEEENDRLEKANKLEELKLKQLANNPTGLMVPMPPPLVPRSKFKATDSGVSSKSSYRSIDDE